MFEGKEEIERVLTALSEQLEAQGTGRIEMVVCGGAGLDILGYVTRETEDVDVVAFVAKSKNGSVTLIKAKPMNPSLMAAADRVQKDFNLPDDWINAKASSLVDLGLPKGLIDRTEKRKYGKDLTVHFISRYDQIHFKVNAVVWEGGERHYDDLVALKPTDQEIEEAARWCMTHDQREGYRTFLKSVLERIGYKDVADKL